MKISMPNETSIYTLLPSFGFTKPYMYRFFEYWLFYLVLKSICLMAKYKSLMAAAVTWHLYSYWHLSSGWASGISEILGCVNVCVLCVSLCVWCWRGDCDWQTDCWPTLTCYTGNQQPGMVQVQVRSVVGVSPGENWVLSDKYVIFFITSHL